MKVISIGTDRKIFEEGSLVRRRMVEYGNLFEELHIVVFSGKTQLKIVKISENVFVYPTNSRNKLFYIFDAFHIVRNLTINHRPQTTNLIISTQDPFEIGFIGVLLKMRFGLSLQVQLHTDFNNRYFPKHSFLNLVRFLLAYIVLPYADSVRVVSERIKESIKELNNNITVLPINIPQGNSSGSFPKELPWVNILTVARLEKEKDLETAIKVFAEVVKKYPKVVFTIAGEGSQKKKLEQLVGALGIKEKVKFIGWISDTDSLYNSSSIYLSTSLYEGYGMSIVEAGSYGLALVLSDAGIAGEIPSLVCKQGDIKSFVAALDKLLSDENFIREMGDRAKKFVSNHVISQGEYLVKYKVAVEQSLVKKKENFIKAIFRSNKMLRFLLAGGTAAFTQIGLLYVFTDLFNTWYLYSSILSFGISFIISFLLQKFWVFRDKDIKNSHTQFFKYIIVGLFGIGLNTTIMYIFVTLLFLWYILAQVVTGLIVAVFNFFVYKKFIFSR